MNLKRIFGIREGYADNYAELCAKWTLRQQLQGMAQRVN